MRRANQETIPEKFVQQLAKLTTRVAELSRRIELIVGYRGNALRAEESDHTILSHDDGENAIQLLTENDFVIVRAWEARGFDTPAQGTYRFLVQDPQGIEREIAVEISDQLISETVFRTRERIQISSEFWICCAERHLANYVMERGEFPPGNHMTICTLDREDVLMAIHWGRHD